MVVARELKALGVAVFGTVAVACVCVLSMNHTQFQSLQFNFGLRFPPIHMDDGFGPGHDRVNNELFFKLRHSHPVSSSSASSSSAFSRSFGDSFGGNGVVHETEIIERPGPNGTMVQKKYVYDNRGSGSGNGSREIVTMTPAQVAEQEKEEKVEMKREFKRERRMESDMNKMFSNFFGGGGGSSSDGSRHGYSRVEWIPIGRVKPERQWRTTKRLGRSRKTHAPNQKAPKASAPKTWPQGHPTRPPAAPANGPVVHHAVVSGLAATNTARQQLAGVDEGILREGDECKTAGGIAQFIVDNSSRCAAGTLCTRGVRAVNTPRKALSEIPGAAETQHWYCTKPQHG